MLYSERITIFAVKKTKWQEKRSGYRFVSRFCKSLTTLCQYLAQQNKLRKENSKIIKSIFCLSALASMTDRQV